VTFKSSGGAAFFPGLAKPATIESEGLEESDRLELEALVREARFFELPDRIPPSAGAADYQTYSISIEQDGRVHAVTVSDAGITPELQALVQKLRVLVRKSRPSK
jgi:hypothetical protein